MVNYLVDEFINFGYLDVVIIVEWKDGFNEVWVDFLEFIDIRIQIFVVFYELYKFYYDVKEIFGCIQDKYKKFFEEFGRDQNIVEILQRMYIIFEYDIQVLGIQVRQLQEDVVCFQVVYVGDKVDDIQKCENEVLEVWKFFLDVCESCRVWLVDIGDKFCFFSMVCDFMFWMEDVIWQIEVQEKLRDVLFVEFLMNNY